METTQPVAISTKLGWYAYGPGQQMSKERNTETFQVHFVKTQTKWQDLVTEFLESKHFVLNNLPIIEPVDDTRAKKLLTETTIRFHLISFILQ